MTRAEKIEKFIREEIKLRHIDLLDYINAENVNSFNDIYEQVEEQGGFNVEIIYYSRAMEYLMENDTSLQNSMELAADFGYTPENINSELLASLLASQYSMEELYKCEHEITEFFNTLDNEEE
jgi:hypothetical protein